MSLFFGMEVSSPWPDEFPPGRKLLEADRHLTLAFMGKAEVPDLQTFPKPPFSIGFGGIFDEPLFLGHVVAWHIQWLENGLPAYQKTLVEWLGIKNNFLAHVTLARRPFKKTAWKEAFEPLPMFVKNINLYKSLGYSKYEILWQYPLKAPFDEIEHTADLAFLIRKDHYLHAQLALAFHFPPMIHYFDFRKITDLNEIITALNGLIANADSEIGCPFKAVSFHGTRNENDEWEMIVDV